MNLKIAGMHVDVDVDNAYVEHRVKKYFTYEDSGNIPTDLHITFQENNGIVVPEGKDYQWHEAWYWIDRGAEGYSAIKQFSSYHANLVRMDIDKACKNVHIQYIDVKDKSDFTTDFLLHHYMGEAFTFCQTERNATVLHSAAVAYKGQAVLFSAPSETGKSTHTGLWKQFYPNDVVLFNDDTPVIRPIKTQQGETLYACGTPWSGKTEINENIEVPLSAIVFLKQAKTNSIRRLSTVEAVVNLLNQTRKPVFEHLMDKHMDILQNIVANTPIYELGCTISKEAVDLVKSTVFGEG